ncbi:replication protein [Pantoea sp. FN060301]|uniref:replication protein n=1 Tax=Pantoea sp. FN060301 TaxID=3420380 RepID=UPI003D16568C
MTVVRKLSDYRPSSEGMERRVAQLEDGYTRLANALYDELIGADLTKNQSKVAHAICRKTYGFGKKMDRIADSQLAELTRLPRQKVNKAKNELIAMRVILRDGNKIGPNKEVSQWQIEGCHYSGDNVTALVTNKVTKTVTGVSPKQSHTKETITKEKKESNKTLSEQVQTIPEKAPKPANKNQETDEAFESFFWRAGMVKLGKQKAVAAFRSQFQAWRKESGGTPQQFAQMLAEDITIRLGKQYGFDKLHPTSYLNGKRWQDEKPEAAPVTSNVKSAITVSKSGYVFIDR